MTTDEMIPAYLNDEELSSIANLCSNQHVLLVGIGSGTVAREVMDNAAACAMVALHRGTPNRVMETILSYRRDLDNYGSITLMPMSIFPASELLAWNDYDVMVYDPDPFDLAQEWLISVAASGADRIVVIDRHDTWEPGRIRRCIPRPVQITVSGRLRVVVPLPIDVFNQKEEV